MSFAATWLNLWITILCEVRQRQVAYDITYMWNLNNDTNELICETDSRIRKQIHSHQRK